MNEELVLSSLRAQEAAEAAEKRAADFLAMAELREQLIGILGHDLRTPLAAMMMGVGTLIAHGQLTESDARVASRILNSGNRMSRMISQIMEFTRARLGGGFLLDRRPGVHLGEVCQTVADEFELAASVPVHYTADGDVSGNWDVDRLTEVLSNIAGNAIEHARKGTCVTLRAYDAGADAVVEIMNEGLPIPSETLPLIFKPFRRAQQRDRSKAGNLGLGLFIAHEIVLAHGGSLSARSGDGWTVFTMRLPRAARLP